MNSMFDREITRRKALWLFSAPLLASLVGCGGLSSSSNNGVKSVSYRWTGTMLNAISNQSLGPPITARALALVSTAIFDAWAAYDENAVGTQLGGTLRRPTSERSLENKQKAVSFAAYRMLVNLFPAQLTRFNDQMAALGYDPTDTALSDSTPAGIGNTVAAAIIAFRASDGSNQGGNYADTTGYVPINTPSSVIDPSKWQRLQFANGNMPNFLAPHWQNVVPFALTSPSAIRPAAPPAYGSPTYLAQVQEVLDVMDGLDDRKKCIAEYWADGPATVQPPGHWHLFGQYVSDRDRHTLDEDVKMFFMLSNAVFDAGIACWDAKRFYNTSRPYTAIRALYAGQEVPSFIGGTLTSSDGAAWMPYQSPNFITPPFPEYTSGHSTFSSAAAEILKRFSGSDRFDTSATIPANSSTFESGVPAVAETLGWNTFTEAAQEAGSSRIYGGIHFRAGNLEGQTCGRAVGEAVWNMAQSYINGTAPTARV